MFPTVSSAVDGLREAMASLEPRTFRGDDAARLLKLFAEAERLAAAGKTLMARRVEETNLWQRDGHRSAAGWLAATTGSSVGSAVGTLETARRLEALPATAEAQRAGRLSEAQAREISSAAAVDPGAEADLLAAARREPVAALRQRCQRVRASAADDEVARHRAVHQRRHLRHWTDADGAFRMDLAATADAGATILANLKPFCDQAFAEARAAGRRESTEAYAADALVAMAEAAGGGTNGAPRASGPRAVVHVRVDHEALLRGRTEAGEVCEIPGVGPIPVATARAWAGDAVLKALVTNGVDVVAVAHAGRTVTAAQRVALEERDPACVVAGCSVTNGLEIDHVDGWALTHSTTLERLARLCRWHHHLKTYCSYRLEGCAGNWRLVAPDHPPDNPAGPGSGAARRPLATLDLGLTGSVSTRPASSPDGPKGSSTGANRASTRSP